MKKMLKQLKLSIKKYYVRVYINSYIGLRATTISMYNSFYYQIDEESIGLKKKKNWGRLLASMHEDTFLSDYVMYIYI